MRNLALAIGTASALISSMAIGGHLQAAPYADGRIKSELGGAGLIQNIQYVWEGQNYCWYDDGWHGPGWYLCGYRTRQGMGWGGERGWRNWERREWREEHREERREDRREDRGERRENRREDRRDRY
jgi:hypothetical protein